MSADKRLYTHLLELEVVDSSVLNAVYKEAQNTQLSLAENLMHHGLVTSQTITQLMADVLGVSPVFFSKITPDPKAVALLPFEFMRHNTVLPFSQKDDLVEVAVAYPDDIVTLSFLKKRFADGYKIYYALQNDIEKELGNFSPTFEDEIQEILHASQQENNTVHAYRQLVSSIIDRAHQQNASDVHIESWPEGILVRFRIDGIMHDAVELPKQYAEGLVRRVKVLAHLPTDKHSEPLDGTIHDRNRHLNMRVSVMPVQDGEKIVLRLLRDDQRHLHLSELGLRSEDQVLLKEASTRSDGMILTVGPTGSGKTTTLYALMQILNSSETNITTIEDPIEYDMPRINQIQVNSAVGLTFDRGLRSIVRQDPDVILVGEIRDEETANIAVNAALTGHLMLSTLHASDAVVSIARLTQLGIEPYLVASSVLAVVSQRLVRRLCSKCRLSVEHSNLIKEVKLPKSWEEKISSLSRTYKSVGCEECNNTGYVGRTGVYEVLRMTEKIRESIVAEVESDQLRELALAEGMHSMEDDGLQKVRSGETSVAELLRVFGQKE